MYIFCTLQSYPCTFDKNRCKFEQTNRKKLFSAEVDAYRVNARGCDILDYASSSDSDVEPTVVSDTLRGIHLDDSDNESLNSPQEDPLK